MSCCVSLDGLLSDRFSIKQGVRKGGVLSPWLFTLSSAEASSDSDKARAIVKRAGNDGKREGK